MRTVGMLVLGVLLWGRPGSTQELVYDALNHVSNTTTSFQTTISAIQSVLQTAHMVTNLLGLTIADTAEYYQTLNDMMFLLNDARALAWDFGSIARQVEYLFRMDNAPDSTYALYQRQQEIDRTLWEVYSYATATHRLVATLTHTIDHLKQFIERIRELAGARQALQSINESQSRLVQAQEKQTLMNAAFERAESYQRLQEPLVRESVRRINTEIMADYPTAVR